MTNELSPPLDDPAFHAGNPFPAFRALREKPRLHWHERPGFWAVTRHHEVQAISRDPDLFCSSRGILLRDLTIQVAPRSSIAYIDPPEHATYRKLVQPAFTPARHPSRFFPLNSSIQPFSAARNRSDAAAVARRARRDSKDCRMKYASLVSIRGGDGRVISHPFHP